MRLGERGMQFRLPAAACLLLLTLSLLIGTAGVPVVQALAADADLSTEKAAESVLLLYDSLGNGTPKEGSIPALERLLAAFGAGVQEMSLDDYETGMMNGYSRVISVMNQEPDKNEPHTAEFLNDLAGYSGEYLHVGAGLPGVLRKKLQVMTGVVQNEPVHLTGGDGLDTTFNVTEMTYIKNGIGQSPGHVTLQSVQGQFPFSLHNGSDTYVPYFVNNPGVELTMAAVLKQWFDQKESGQAYLLVKEVYPFSNLELLKYMADQLYEDGIPFIVSVRPVFSHTEYPAMQRYLEMMKYMQARGGRIVVNVPEVMDGVQAQQDELKSDMEGFIDVLIQNGVAPLGVAGEQYWTHDAEYTSKGLAFFDSSVLFPDEKAIYKERLNHSRSFASSLFSLNMADMKQNYGDSPVGQLPVNTAVTYDFPDSVDGLKAMLAELKDSWVTFADYKNLDHKVKTTSNTVQSQNGTILLNGQAVNLNFSMGAVSQNYQYVNETQTSFRKLFQVQNTFFMVIIAFALIFFGGLLLIGRRLYKRKFMK